MKRGWMVLAGAVLIPVPAAAQSYDDCDNRRPISQTLAMGGASVVEVSAGAGTLEVRGVRGLREARITGTACASSSGLLAELSVATGREGSVAYIETRFPDDRSDGEQARIDLIVEIPEGMDAEVTDGSGELEVSGVGTLRLTDGSGSARIESIGGDVDVTDGSGDLTIRGVAGIVSVSDGSGDVRLDDVGGARLTDGSGSIYADVVRGDLIVRDDGSGSIEYARVTGRVDIPERKRRR